MNIILLNFLLLQISVASQLTLWVIIILLVSAAVYFLLKKLSDLQDNVVYREEDGQYIPAERLKFRAADKDDTIGPLINQQPDDDPDVSPPAGPFVPNPAVEYISVARPKSQKSITGAVNEQSETAITPQFEETVPGYTQLKIDADEKPVEAASHYAEKAFTHTEPEIAGHVNEHAASIEQIIASEPVHMNEVVIEEIAVDDMAEQHTEAIPADKIVAAPPARPVVEAVKIEPEPVTGYVLDENASAPVLTQSPQDTAPLFDEEKYINAALHGKADPKINAVLNSLSDIIFEYDERKYCVNLWYNKSKPATVDLEVFRGKSVTEAMGAEKGKIVNDALDFVAANIKPTVIEFPSFYGPGKWFQSRISPVFDDSHNFTGHITSLVSDISEKRQFDAELMQKHLLLIEAQKIARLGDWRFDLISGQTKWSDNLYALLDIETLPKNTGHFEYYISRVLAEDRRDTYRFFADVAGDRHYTNEHRILTDKGNLKYFRIIRGEPVKDPSGKIIRTSGIIQDITETHEFERNIKKTQAELSEAQAISKTGNWKWHPGNKDLTWTGEIYKIYDVDIQIVNSNASYFKLMLKYVHPEDKPAVLGFLKNPANMRRTSCDYRIITPAGKLKYLSLVIARVNQRDDGRIRSMAGTIQDVSERKVAEINIQQTVDNYKLVLEDIKLAAVSLDKNGEIIFCNKYLADLLGYEQQEMIGLNWYEKFVSENLRPVYKEWYQNNHKTEYVSPVICRNGEELIISWQNTTLYDDDGQIKQTTSIGEDVTGRQKERELLLSAKEKAERSSSFKTEFMSTMSHEIRTPMNAVIGATHLLLEEDPRPDQLDHLNNLKFSGENLLGIIDDILDYNKIEAGTLELHKLPLNIKKLVLNIKQTFLPKAQEKKIELFTEIEEQIPEMIIGDTTRITQILNNLLANAIKFTSKGSVTLQVHEAARNDKQIKLNFIIADTGIGIGAKDLQKIFEPFVQAAGAANEAGTGLGLAIIKRLVELHGSKINVKSTPGRGTQFTFTIEFGLPAWSAEKPAAPQQINKMQGANLAGMKVLVVDDNKLNVQIACRFLAKWNVVTNEAVNGQMATEMADSADYDLILMDLQMPVMDGFEASEIIKEKHPGLPIIALTADAMPETFTKTVEYGFDDYLVKPFMPDALFDKVSRYRK